MGYTLPKAIDLVSNSFADIVLSMTKTLFL